MKANIEGWPAIPVFIGGCVERGEGSSFRAKAHAHNLKQSTDSFAGWICVRSTKRLGVYVMNDNGSATITKPSRLIMHELAHILTPEHWHDDTWRKAMRDLGQPIPHQYQKKPRSTGA